MPNKENSAFRPTRGSVRAIVATLIATVALVLMPSPPAGATAVGAVGQGGVSANVVFGPMSAKWWKWLAGQPASANPYLSTDGTNCGQAQQPGPVFFLAGYPNGPIVREGCIIPYGKAVFFPIVNVANVKTVSTETATELWRQLKDDVRWRALSAKVWVDGRPIPGISASNPLWRGCVGPERGCAPRSFSIDLPQDNIFGVVDPVYDLAVADGWYALIPPLARGKHQIRWTGAATFGPGIQTQNVTYNLTVS
jgi:hypothetical protein